MGQKDISSEKLAKLVSGFASGVKAQKVVILDMRKAANFCDYFILCSGTSDRHVRAIAQEIDEGLEKLGIGTRFKQGIREGRWALLDYGTVVAHIFDLEFRDFYGLEYLWRQAAKVDWIED
ncbi:MAG: ribosome silencing factor [Candidatus Omnitrophota bacterium]